MSGAYRWECAACGETGTEGVPCCPECDSTELGEPTADAGRMVGTGRMNRTGATATITMPKECVEMWGLGENGLDVVWFTDGARLFAVPKSEVGVR